VGKNLHSLIVVSPEGSLRYWSEIGKPCQDESLLMNSDVVHSLSLINSSGRKNILYNFYFFLNF
jgi:hypothetical protein